VPPPAGDKKQNESTPGTDDWDQARKELRGVRETPEVADPFGNGVVPYNAEQVGVLKRALLEALKNVANIRGLNLDESAVVTVSGTKSVPPFGGGAGGFDSGGGNVGTVGAAPNESVAPLAYQPGARGESWSGGGRETFLTVRVKKSDAEAFATGKMNFDQFQQKATINAYLGAARSGFGSRGRSGAYSVAPVPGTR
jgi:hypothetical protein